MKSLAIKKEAIDPMQSRMTLTGWKANLYLIDPEGKIAFHTKANFDEGIYQQLKVVVERQ